MASNTRKNVQPKVEETKVDDILEAEQPKVEETKEIQSNENSNKTKIKDVKSLKKIGGLIVL